MSARFLLVILLLLAGCIPQYSRPQLDPKDVQFRGVASYLLEAPRLKVIFVHGMCTHEPDEWIDKRWDPQIRRTLAAELGSRDVSAVPDAERPYFVARRVYSAANREIDARFVMWSSSTRELKAKLHYDNSNGPGAEFTWKRARVNRSIKAGLVNDCLSDPVIYAGQEHARLRGMMKSALCEALDLRYDEASGTCVVGGPTINQPILVVTESLGSKMVFDAMLDLGSGNGGSPALQRALAAVPQVYMLANQLPLLDLAIPRSPDEGVRSVAPRPDGTARAVADLLLRSRAADPSASGQSRGPGGRAPLSLVAFTDPNDLLSYRLPTENWPAGVTVANVLDSNAGTLLGFVEDPRPAHSGYHANPDVMRLVLCGSGNSDCEALRSEATRQ